MCEEEFQALSCPICFENYSSDGSGCRAPRILLCGHTFCSFCIDELLANIWSNDEMEKCPICKFICPLSETKVNYALCSIVEESSQRNTEKEKLTLVCAECKQLAPRNLLLFCFQCNRDYDELKTICVFCAVEQHRGHRCENRNRMPYFFLRESCLRLRSRLNVKGCPNIKETKDSLTFQCRNYQVQGKPLEECKKLLAVLSEEVDNYLLKNIRQFCQYCQLDVPVESGISYNGLDEFCEWNEENIGVGPIRELLQSRILNESPFFCCDKHIPELSTTVLEQTLMSERSNEVSINASNVNASSYSKNNEKKEKTSIPSRTSRMISRFIDRWSFS